MVMCIYDFVLVTSLTLFSGGIFMKKCFVVVLVGVLVGLVFASISWAITPMVLQGDFPDGTVGVRYRSWQDVKVLYVPDDYPTWEVVSGTLPPGLTLRKNGWVDGINALLEGSPTQAGSYRFTIKVSAKSRVTNVVSGAKEFVVTIAENPDIPKIAIYGEFPDGVIDQTYSNAVESSGGTSPFSWSLTSGNIPDGLTLKGTTTETITLSGIPTKTGEFTFSLTVEDMYGTATKRFSMTITDGNDPDDPDDNDNNYNNYNNYNNDNNYNNGQNNGGGGGGGGGGCDIAGSISALILVLAGAFFGLERKEKM